MIDKPDKELVEDMVQRYPKWGARGTPLPIIMNKILVNIIPIIRKVVEEERLDRPELGEKIADALGCGLCVCRKKCLSGDPFKDCPHSNILPKLVALIPDEKATAEEEALAVIRCIKDAKRIHPDWGIDDIIHLLEFREETRQAIKVTRLLGKEDR